ncbi:MAG: hypothetical protein H7Y13_11960 [Sphingobacteriaceae bacterium]|nr:hypothetical protein [Sphingobacteriaceae bacterium]
MSDKPKFKPEPRLYTWWTNRPGNRYFVIVGLWHGQHESIELLEYTHLAPMPYSKDDFQQLIDSGDIKPLTP